MKAWRFGVRGLGLSVQGLRASGSRGLGFLVGQRGFGREG